MPLCDCKIMHFEQGKIVGFSLEDLMIYASLMAVQIGFAAFGVVMGDQLSKGLNALSFVVYSNGFGALVLSPFAFFLEKKKRPTMNLSLFCKFLLLSLGGVCALQTLLMMGLKNTSPAFASAMPNLAPGIIFVMAWILGMEQVDIKCNYSRLKIAGTVICVCGAMAMSFLEGPALSQLWPNPTAHSNPAENLVHTYILHKGHSNKKIVGCIYLLSAVVIMSWTTILQADTVKKYPATLSLAAITSLLGSIQTAILQIILDRGINTTSWFVNKNGIMTILFAGGVCTGLVFAVQVWCMQKRGPVFVAIFSPVSTVCSVVLSSLVLGETFHLGSLMGILLIFAGLYFVLWGKNKDYMNHKICSDEEEQLTNAEVDDRRQELDAKKPLLQ
eukprot:Gb_30801 [translate_table: standard]